MNEYDSLERFWLLANGGRVSRLALLREYAEIVLGPCLRPADVRAYSQAVQAQQRARECFACGWKRRMVRLIWHHVIQVQHGGSASLWNHVRLCEDCHAQVHPWLTRPSCKGWVSMRDSAAMLPSQARYAEQRSAKGRP